MASRQPVRRLLQWFRCEGDRPEMGWANGDLGKRSRTWCHWAEELESEGGIAGHLGQGFSNLDAQEKHPERMFFLTKSPTPESIPPDYDFISL